jgi:hypothetical protein
MEDPLRPQLVHIGGGYLREAGITAASVIAVVGVPVRAYRRCCEIGWFYVDSSADRFAVAAAAGQREKEPAE